MKVLNESRVGERGLIVAIVATLAIALLVGCAHDSQVVAATGSSSTTTTKPDASVASTTTIPTTSTTVASAPDRNPACAYLEPHVVVRGRMVGLKKAWTNPDVIAALEEALPYVPDEPMSDGRTAKSHFQTLLDGSRAEAADPRADAILGADPTQVLGWISEACFGMPAAAKVLPPGATIG